MADSGRTVFGGTGGGGTGLFSMAHRIWFPADPLSGTPSQVVNRGPSFGWALEAGGSPSGDFTQYRNLRFSEAGIFSVSLSCNVVTPTADPLSDRGVSTTISADTTGGYSQSLTDAAAYAAGTSTAIGSSLTFATDVDDLFVLRATSNDGGMLEGAYIYLTVVKLAPYA